MGQIRLMSGPERRRRFTEDQKRAILAAAFAPGASVADVARQADIGTGLIYRWRGAFRRGDVAPSFSRALVVDDGEPPVGPTPAGTAIVVEISGARVQIGGAASTALVTATLRALRP
jgi:transposase